MEQPHTHNTGGFWPLSIMIQILLIALISLFAQLVLPWWSLAIVAFGVCFWRSDRAGQAFLYGFAGVALVWLAYAWLIYFRTDGRFVVRMSQLLFKSDGVALPFVVTALLGGIVGGMAGLSGFLLKRARGNQAIGQSS